MAASKPLIALLVIATIAVSLQVPASYAQGKDAQKAAAGVDKFQSYKAERTTLQAKALPRGFTKSLKAEQKIDPKIESSGNDTVTVIVEGLDEYNRTDLGQVKSLRIKEFETGNFFLMEIPASELGKLEKSGYVKKVWADTQYSLLLDISAPLVGAGLLWDSGYDGTGIKVCVLDTGINRTHPAMDSRVVAEKDFVTSDSDGDSVSDFNGHGTHVAGIAAGNDSVYKGIAPRAGILNAKVFNSTTTLAATEDIITAMDWCMSQGADILTMSLGAAESPTDGSDVLSRYVDLVVDQGKTVTVAAGNSGPYQGTINCPGCAHKAITVGSVQSGKSSTVQDLISSFSSRGNTSDYRIKPDVVAPGQPVTSAYYAGGWISYSGTSMSTPMVAGLSALILQSRNMTPGELKALIMNTAVDLGTPGKDSSYGAGRINASRVVAEINNTVTGTIGTSGYRAHSIFVPAGSSEIRATLYWPENYSVHNDIDLYLLDPSGNIRSYSYSQYNTDEMVKLQDPLPSGNWKLLVDPYDAGNSSYVLASNFKPLEQMRIEFGNATGNVSYHKINVTGSGVLNVSLDWNSTDANLDLYVYSPNGTLANHSASGSNNYEELKVRDPASGLWIARIAPSPGSNATFYSLGSTSPVLQQFADAEPPEVNMTSPAAMEYNASGVSLIFTAKDNLGLPISCWMNLDSSASFMGEITTGANVTYNMTLGNGNHGIYVSCTDKSNNAGASQTANFSVNVTEPAINFKSLSDLNNSFVSRNYTNIYVNATDVDGVDSCFVEWDGVNISMEKYGSGSYATCYINKTDADGTHSYKVYANDSAGNAASVERIITFDTVPPAKTAYYPGQNSYVNGSQSQLFGVTYTEANMDSAYFYWKSAAQDNYTSVLVANCASGANATCWHLMNLSGYAEGYMVRFFFFIVDRAGNTGVSAVGTEPYNATIDRTPPSVELTSPQNSSYYNNNSIDLNFTVSGGKLDKTWYRIDENESAFISGNLSLNVSEGAHYVYLSANDTAGNSNYSAATFTIDTAPPRINFSADTPYNIVLRSKNSAVINASVSETAGSVVLEWNGANETMDWDGMNWLRNKTGMADGNYTFRVYASDAAGNINVSETRWVAINVTRNVTSLIGGLEQVLEDSNATVMILDSNGSATGNSLLSFSNYTLQFNVSGVLVQAADFLGDDLNQSALANVTENISAGAGVSSAFNSSGGVMDRYVWVNMNNMLPGSGFTAKITFPKAYAIYFYLNGTSDNVSAIRAAELCNANATNKPCYNISSGSSVLYLPSFSGGAGGNDTQAPSVLVASPAATSYSSLPIAMNYAAGDNVAVDKCWYRLNGGPDVALENCWNSTISPAAGSNTVTVYANDTSGNSNQSSVSFAYSPPSQPSGGGGGGGGGSSAYTNSNYTALSQAKQNQTNATIAAAGNPVAADIPPVLNNTTGNETSQEENAGGEINEAAAGENAVTGLATASYIGAAAGAAAFTIIAAAILYLWKPWKKRKKR